MVLGTSANIYLTTILIYLNFVSIHCYDVWFRFRDRGCGQCPCLVSAEYVSLHPVGEHFKDAIDALTQEQTQVSSNISDQGVPTINYVLKLMSIITPNILCVLIFTCSMTLVSPVGM